MFNIKNFMNYSKENGGSYFTQIFEQRTFNSPMRAGSYYEINSSNELIKKFESIEGTEVLEMREADNREPENPKKYKAYYRLPLEGKFGLVNLESLDGDTELMVKAIKEDTPKSLLINSPVLKDGSAFTPSVCKTTLMLVSVDEEAQTGFILTVYPESGTTADVNRSEVMDLDNVLGNTITAAEALKKGFKWAKVIE